MKKQRLTGKNAALGRKIRYIRDKAGLFQEALAVKTGLTQIHISLLEIGNRGVSISTFQKIASAVGCKTKDLIPF